MSAIGWKQIRNGFHIVHFEIEVIRYTDAYVEKEGIDFSPFIDTTGNRGNLDNHSQHIRLTVFLSGFDNLIVRG